MLIETNRLILRNLELSDVQGIFELDSDPDVHKYLGNNPIKTLKEAEGIVTYIRNQYTQHGIGRWAVIDKLTNEFIGWSGLKYETQVKKDEPYFDIGYRLKKKFWGKGIATESAKLALAYGFEELKLKEISGAADVQNIASNKILQKIGLKYANRFNYDNEPHNWYTITNRMWQAQK